jgi:hypothetical protein
MPHDANDDLRLLADRLRLGIPLRGFDGRQIPLRNAAGEELEQIAAARELLASAVILLPGDYAEAFIHATQARAVDVELEAWAAGATPSAVIVRVTAVYVSAAVRASILARCDDPSPSEINRATLSWYEMSQLRRRELLEGGWIAQDEQRSA